MPRLFALHVGAGREDSIARRIARAGAGLVRDAFCLRSQVMRRREGAWVIEERALYPGYVFVEADEAWQVSEALGLLAETPAVLGGESADEAGVGPVALGPAEEAVVCELGGRCHVIGFSRGRIEAGRLVVEEGPLRGRERLVTRIDRHKRLAWLGGAASGLPGRGAPSVGLEVVSKS